MAKAKPKGNPIVKIAILLCVLAACIWIADIVYDQTYDYNKQCESSGVKSATNKGLFKISAECK